MAVTNKTRGAFDAMEWIQAGATAGEQETFNVATSNMNLVRSVGAAGFDAKRVAPNAFICGVGGQLRLTTEDGTIARRFNAVAGVLYPIQAIGGKQFTRMDGTVTTPPDRVTFFYIV